MSDTTFIGLDVHKEKIFVAMLPAMGKTAVQWELPNDSTAAKKLARRFEREGSGTMHACYEAGPCGYVLQRQLAKAGVRCDVIAPSLIPVKPGDRVKTDRRDAKKLAELLRAEVLTVVHAPSEAEEAVRDLCRCREDAKSDEKDAGQRLTKFLLRHGCIWRGGKPGSRCHLEWVRGIRFDDAVQQAVLDEYLVTFEQRRERVRAIEEKMTTVSLQEPYREAVAHLRCFRGFDMVTAMSLVAELHDIRRFKSPRELMAYLGLCPSEYTSANKQRRGAITKAGNGHARRLLVEAAWHYRHRPAVGKALRARRRDQSVSAIAIADKAMVRLHRRHWSLLSRGKAPNVATVAIARELVGFVWATLTA